MIELGGNIKLDGFESLEPAQLIVVKKFVGNYAKDLSEKSEYSEFLVILENNKIKIKVTGKDKTIEEEDETDNMFITLNSVLAKVKEAI